MNFRTLEHFNNQNVEGRETAAKRSPNSIWSSEKLGLSFARRAIFRLGGELWFSFKIRRNLSKFTFGTCCLLAIIA